MLKAHSHAFWVYGVIVGLAIRESLAKVIPHALPQLSQTTNGQAVVVPLHDTWLEAIRLAVFLGLIIRFYLGSAIYFDAVYCSDTADGDYPSKNYGIDFLLGLIHFILFFVWSETLIGSDRFAHGLSGFLLVLGGILLYDIIWWLVSLKYSTKVTIRAWALLNLLTVGAAYAILLFFNQFQWLGDKTNEVLCLIPIVLMTLADFGEMFTKKNLVTDWIVRILSKAGVDS